MRIVSGRRLWPPRTKHSILINSLQTISHHQLSKRLIGQLVLTIGKELDLICKRRDCEIEIVFIGKSSYSSSKCNTKINYLFSLDSKRTAVAQSYIETVILVFFYYIRTHSISHAFASYNLIGVEVALGQRENLIEITSVELENPIAPVFSLQIAIHDPC